MERGTTTSSPLSFHYTSVQLDPYLRPLRLSVKKEAMGNKKQQKSESSEAGPSHHLSVCRGASVCGLGETDTLDTPSAHRLFSRLHSLPRIIPKHPSSWGSGFLCLQNFFLELLEAAPPNAPCPRVREFIATGAVLH